MVTPQAALMVLDHVPDEDEVTQYAAHHLEDFPADEAFATIEITTDVPTWLSICEQDQMSAFLRDGAVCILIIYMQEGSVEEDEY
jgi:hypothetical protein